MGRTAETDVDIAERLFLFRESRGWTQTRTAKEAGVSREALVLTETGKSHPRLTTLRRLARTFGVTVDEFLHGPIPEREQEKK